MKLLHKAMALTIGENNTFSYLYYLILLNLQYFLNYRYKFELLNKYFHTSGALHQTQSENKLY